MYALLLRPGLQSGSCMWRPRRDGKNKRKRDDGGGTPTPSELDVGHITDPESREYSVIDTYVELR